MKTTSYILFLALVAPLAAAPITFESPDYLTATPFSTDINTTTDRLFNGQQGWSQSTSNGAGQIIATSTSGAYTVGQGLVASSTDQTYIGAKAGVVLTNYSFDFRYQPKELGLGGWNDDDADGKFDQTEAGFMPGIVALSSGTAFGLRIAGFGATGGTYNGRISTGTTGINGNWYRMTVTPDFANLQVSLAVHDLTKNLAVTLATSTFTLTSIQFGGNPSDYDGITARVSGSNTTGNILDNIYPDGNPVGPPDPLPGGGVQVAANGAWTWFNDNQAIVLANGRHLIGYVKSDGNVAATSFDPVTATGSEMILSGTGAVQFDDHNNPSFTPLGDGRIFTAYSRHDPDKFWFHRSSTSADPRVSADFGAQTQGPTMPRGNSYSNAFRLSAENRIYHFSRSINYNPTLTTSTDEGQTWITPVQFIRTGTGSLRPYVRYASNHTDRIDAIYTDGHPRDVTNSLYHLVISGGSVQRSDGSLVRSISQLPVLHDAPDLERGSAIYTYSAAAWGVDQGPNDWIPFGRAWSWDIHRGTDDQPVAVFTVRVADVTGIGWNHYRIYYYYARWDGTQWRKSFIAHAGRPLYSAEPDYAGGICIDPADPRVVYLSTNAASPFALGSITSVPLAANERYEIYRGFTTDGGLSFTWEAVTQNSAADNLRPVVPENHGRDRTLLWFNGTYTSYTNYSTRVLGLFGTENTGYAEWASGLGLATNSQNIDTDMDGHLNLLEYATGGNPHLPDSSGITMVSPTGAFEFSALRDRADVEWIAEYSTNLTNWQEAARVRRNSLPSSASSGFTLSPVGTSGSSFRVVSSTAATTVFFRLRVSPR